MREVTEMILAAAEHSKADQAVRTLGVPISLKPSTREELGVAVARVLAK